jgi:hypothetical protein
VEEKEKEEEEDKDEDKKKKKKKKNYNFATLETLLRNSALVFSLKRDFCS